MKFTAKYHFNRAIRHTSSKPMYMQYIQMNCKSNFRVKLAGRKSALNSPVVYFTDRSKAVISVLVLLFVALWFILRGGMF